MDNNNNSAGKCPVMHGGNTSIGNSGTKNMDWWPNQLNLKILHQNDTKSNPLGVTIESVLASKQLARESRLFAAIEFRCW